MTTVALATALSMLAAGCGSAYPSDLRVESLEKLAHLVTLKVQVADVLRAESGSVTGAWLVKGDALVSVDMSKAGIPAQDAERRTATLLLPSPQVVQPRVDHQRTSTYDVRTGWFTPARKESQMRDEAMRRAQELVEAAAGSGENLRLARDTAEKWLQAFFGQLGWRVNVEWKRPCP